MPMVADEDWMRAVNAVETRIPNRGLETFCMRSMKG